MTETIDVAKGERSAARRGHYRRFLVSSVGRLELRVPQDRDGRFSTQLFGRYQRADKALLATLVEMYVSGVSTRKERRITEELCGHSFSASSISNLVKDLDAQLAAFAARRIEQPFPYLVLDARYESVRENGVVGKHAVLIAVGIDTEGRRHVLGVDLANHESGNWWKDFLLGLRDRGLKGVRFVSSDDHPGLRRAVTEVFPSAVQQRCYVHFLANARDRLSGKKDEACIKDLRRLYDCRDLASARCDLASWLQFWEGRAPRLARWVEENIEDTFSFFSLSETHRRHMRSTSVFQRLNQEIKRRSRVVRIFPNRKSCHRLVLALLVEIHESWQVGRRYLDMQDVAQAAADAEAGTALRAVA